jgi:hypothetical protein
MNSCVVISLIFLVRCAIAHAQEITLSEIHPMAIRPDYTRFEYIFSAKNNTPHRLNIVGYAALLDPGKNVMDQRFVTFETRPGAVSACSIESDIAPESFSENPGPARFYRLALRDNSTKKSLNVDGDLVAPIAERQ